MRLSALSAMGVVAGCATNPVNGRRQLMLVSEAEEISMDRQWAPHQVSADYGAVQDKELNAYVGGLGNAMATHTHRPAMPYNFRVVNAPMVNGYTMPGGSVALARGLMLELGSESELAAVLGHELGHVNARHAGERMSKAIIAELVIAGIGGYFAKEKEKYAALAAGLGTIGATLLLCRYSRDDEREADALGMEYAARSEISPVGMSGVMKAFMDLHKKRPGSVELLFATHPMSQERYDTAVRMMKGRYAYAAGFREDRERYMDQTARLRKIRPAVESLQRGDEAMMAERFGDAERLYTESLRSVPDDYAGLLLMAKCCLSQDRTPKALDYAEQACQRYPEEPQGLHVRAMAKMKGRKYDSALADFTEYERRLPGNPNSLFLRGYCFEQMGQRKPAAEVYAKYLQSAPSGEHADYVRQRLAEWGVS